MRVLVVVALAGALAGPAVGNDQKLAELLSKPAVKTAASDYAAAVSVYAHFIGACEENYDRNSVDAALGEVLKRRSEGDQWDRLNDMFTAIWSQSYSEGRQKATEYGYDLARCETLLGNAKRDIVRDRAAFEKALAFASRVRP